jgi:ferric-dicitrate binding protein FerR (iron transport regulator)
MEQKRKDTQGEAMIGKLIAAAGPGETADAEAKQRVYDAVQARWHETVQARTRQETERHNRFRRFRIYGLAASLAIAAVTVYWLQGFAPEDAGGTAIAELARVEGSAERLRDGEIVRLASQDAGIRAGDELRTGADGKLSIAIGDNLSLRVNVDSNLVLTAVDEIQLLAGTIYIDSGADAVSSSLEVTTPFGTVEHVGTQYEVHVDMPGLRVRVREGAIAYMGEAGVVMGAAGQQLDIDAAGIRSIAEIAPDDNAWAWVTDLAALPFARDHRVAEVLAWVARERGLVLVYEDEILAERLADDNFRGQDLSGYSPADVLEVIDLGATEFRYEITNGQLVVLN